MAAIAHAIGSGCGREECYQAALAEADRSPVQQDIRRALDTQAALAERGPHRVGWPHLVTAAVAERHGVTLLHYRADYDLIAEVTGQPVEWVVPRGSVP